MNNRNIIIYGMLCLETQAVEIWKLKSFGTCICMLSYCPLPSNRHYLSCDACLEVKREDNQNCSVLCCVRQLCTMISTLR